MTVWKKVEDEDCYAVAIYNYSPPETARVPHLHLPLEVGDLVRVTRRCASWVWARSVRSAREGCAPSDYVVPRKCTQERRDGEVVSVSAGDALEHDIAEALRSWLPLWKELYKARDSRFKFTEVSMRALLQLRGEAGAAPPLARRRRLHATAYTAIDKGDRTLGRPLVVRGSEGRALDPLSLSLHHLLEKHLQTDRALDKNMETSGCARADSAPPELALRRFALLVTVHQLVAKVEGPAELQLALYDAQGNKLTEHLLARLAAPAAVSVLFTDLSVEWKRERLFLGGVVTRWGPLEPPAADTRRMSGGIFGGGAGGGGGGAAGGADSPAGGVTSRAVRRPCGAAAADVTLSATNVLHQDVPLPYYPYEKESLDALLRKIITNKELKDTKNTQALWVTIQPLEGDLQQGSIKEGSKVARPMRLPQALAPDDCRHELYVTLVSAQYGHRNIQLQARLQDHTGHQYERGISLGAGAAPADEYRSVVYYRDERPRWGETFKIVLGVEEFKDAYLVIFARHRSSNEAKDRSSGVCGASYLRLMSAPGTTVPDARHVLAVYKIEYKKCVTQTPELEAGMALLGVPSHKADLPPLAERGLTRTPLALSPKEHLTVDTLLCSTRLTQREEILGILKWSARLSEGDLRGALTRLQRVPNDELVKFMPDVLDALFAILTQVEEEHPPALVGYSADSYGVLVLDGILRVLALVADHKYTHFCAVLHHYLRHAFCAALAYERLLPVVSWVMEASDDKRLLQCMKCVEWIALVCARSRGLYLELHPPTTPGTPAAFTRFLRAIEALMRRGDHALTSQGALLKYLAPAVEAIATVYPLQELARLVVSALAALPLSRLGKQRAACEGALAAGALGRGAARDVLLPHLARDLAALLHLHNERAGGGGGDRVEKAARLLGADTADLHHYRHHHHMVELCVCTLGEVSAALLAHSAARALLARHTLPALRAAALAVPEGDVTRRRIECVILDMLWDVPRAEFSSIVVGDEETAARESAESGVVLDGDEGEGDGGEGEGEGGDCGVVSARALELCAALLEAGTAPPPDHHAQLHRATLRRTLHAMDLVASVLERAWRLPSPPLALVAAWAARVAAAGGHVTLRSPRDARLALVPRRAAQLLADMWTAAAPRQWEAVGPLVEATLQMSLCSQHRTLLPVLLDMLRLAHQQGAEQLRSLETQLLIHLDGLLSAGQGGADFAEVLKEYLASESSPAVLAAGERVREAAERRVRLRQHEHCAPARRHYTTALLSFYKDTPLLYARYVSELAGLHRAAGDWPEAARALQLLAHSQDYPLKEELYMEIVNLLERGRQWEMCAEVLHELVAHYQLEGGYQALSGLHLRLSELYQQAHTQPRSPHSYYRVTYWGARTLLDNDLGYVYRGEPLEQLASFRARCLAEWPHARLWDSLDAPPDHVAHGDQLYIQVVPVTPAESAQKPAPTRVSSFVHCRPRPPPPEEVTSEGEDSSGSGSEEEDEFARMWIERTEIHTETPLPDILRWARVCSATHRLQSPAEVAVQSVLSSRDSLRTLAANTAREPRTVHQLTMRLTGILDPAVQGGLARYEQAFLSPRARARRRDDPRLLHELEALIVDHVPVLTHAVSVHALHVPATLHALHAHLAQRLLAFREHVRAHYGHAQSGGGEQPPAAEGEVLLRRLLSAAPPPDHPHHHDSTSTESSSRSKFFSFNSAQFNPLTRYSSGFATLQSVPKRRDKRRARKSEANSGSSASQWYTSANNSVTSSAVSVASGLASVSSGLASVANGLAHAASAATLHASSGSLHQGDGLQLRELTQQLVPARPPRAEARGSRRASLLAPSNRDSGGTTDSLELEEEEPPPLPAKSRAPPHEPAPAPAPAPPPHDHNNNPPPPAPDTDTPQPLNRYSYDTVVTPRGSFLYSSQHRLRNKRDE